MTIAESTTEETTESPYEPPSYDDINTPVVIIVGLISALVTLLIIMLVQGMCYHWQNNYLIERSTSAVNMPANKKIAEQKAVLEGGDGVVPIEEAMQNVISRYGK